MALINPPEKKLAKSTSVHCQRIGFILFILGERGFVISLNGLNDKLSLLLKTILGHFQKFDENIDLDFFEAVRDQVKKNYYNTFIKPDRVVKELRLFMMQDVYR